MGATHGASVAIVCRSAPGGVRAPQRVLAGDRVLAFAGSNPGPDKAVAAAEYVSLALGATDADALEDPDDIVIRIAAEGRTRS
jgi:hypothetical protein